MSDEVKSESDFLDGLNYVAELGEPRNEELVTLTAGSDIQPEVLAEMLERKETFRVSEIKGFADRLTAKAKEVYKVRLTTTALELDIPSLQNLEVSKSYEMGFPKSEEEEKIDYVKRIYGCQYFAKPCYISDKEWLVNQSDSESLLEPYIQKLADTFSWLVEHDMLAHGVLANALILPLAKIDASMRFLLYLYVFPSIGLVEGLRAAHINPPCDLELEHLEIMGFLNRQLGSRCFMPEGEIGDSDWSLLPPW